MKTRQRIAVVALMANFFVACTLATVHAQAPAAPPAPKKVRADIPPSVIGGKPTTLSVYNYTKGTLTPFWIDPNGVMQPVPDGKPVPPIAGTKPTAFPTFVGATLVFKKEEGGGVGRHLYGRNAQPLIVVGTPDKGTQVPERVQKHLAAKAARASGGRSKANAASDDDGEELEIDPQSFVRLSKSTVIVNNPATPADGRRRGRKAGSINVNVTPPASPAPSTEPATADKKESKGKLPLKANAPTVVEFLRIHNAARADVGASPLEWSDDLARTAQRWAEHIAKTGKRAHSADTQYGELIAAGEADFTPAKAANGWLSEKANFSIDQEPKYRASKAYQTDDGETVVREEDGPTAHYTQMVWSKSTMVGVGIAKTEDGKVVVVAYYNPRGNVAGEKPY